MKTRAITTSYHIPDSVRKYIAEKSAELHLSRGGFLAHLITDYRRTKKENKNLKAYFSMASDRDFLREQIAESEADFLAEIAHNPQLS